MRNNVILCVLCAADRGRTPTATATCRRWRPSATTSSQTPENPRNESHTVCPVCSRLRRTPTATATCRRWRPSATASSQTPENPRNESHTVCPVCGRLRRTPTATATCRRWRPSATASSTTSSAATRLASRCAWGELVRIEQSHVAAVASAGSWRCGEVQIATGQMLVTRAGLERSVFPGSRGVDQVAVHGIVRGLHLVRAGLLKLHALHAAALQRRVFPIAALPGGSASTAIITLLGERWRTRWGSI